MPEKADVERTRTAPRTAVRRTRLLKPACSLVRSGERGRNRTYNLLIKSQLLCQLSYAPVLLF
jgi:hypothetical protein